MSGSYLCGICFFYRRLVNFGLQGTEMSPLPMAQRWVHGSPDHPHTNVLTLATPDASLHPQAPAMAALLRRDKRNCRHRAA